jgi:hypothetical protein
LEINVFVYILQSDLGVIFLYVNYSEIVYEENLSFELGNFYNDRKFVDQSEE